jgi:hypothetical protein
MIRTIIFSSFLFPFIAHAGAAPAPATEATYTLIAPFGSLTGDVTLTKYLEGAFTTLIGIAGILAVLMLVICGIKLMASGSVSGKNEAKTCIWNAIFGVLLALGSWIILQTINPLLLRNDAKLAVDVPAAPSGVEIGSGAGGGGGGGTPTEPSNPSTPGCYFKYKDIKTGAIKFSDYTAPKDGTCIQCNAVRKNFQAYPEQYEILSECYEVKASTSGGSTAPTPPPGDTSGTLMDGVKCGGQPTNLCEPYPLEGGCENSSCAQFSGMVKSAAKGWVTPSFLMSLIVKESSCGLRTTSPAGACGPTQLLPETANANKSGCGITETITCGWLNNKANWEKALCVSVNYLNKNTGSGCGSSVIGVAAGYNGGYGAKTCGPSANCTTLTSCRGGSVRAWECPYSNNAHTTCDTGYRETRNYGPKILYCMQYYQKKGF